MVQWEYKVVWLYRFDGTEGRIERELDRRGLEGWDLCCITNNALYFKRPKEVAPGPGVAVSDVLALNKGETMSGELTVDSAGKSVSVKFLDDKGDTDVAPPNGPDGATATLTFTSDNPAVATLATDPTNPLQGDITLLAEGTFTPGLEVRDSSNNPIMEADGVTTFDLTGAPQVVGPGAAVTDELVLNP
jgi:hypothetical protein